MKKFLVVVCSFILASCGGGGGTSAPSPTITLSAAPTLVLVNSSSTLTWSSTNSTACSAAWTNKTSSSGSEEVTISAAGDNAYSITCSGEGGSSTKSVTVEGYRNSDGVVVDGYISGAEVFIDEDGDWILDSNESSTTSDNDGKFTLKYSNGNLVSIGGTDLDSQNLLDNFLITQKLTGHTEFKAITPVTSIAAFMNEPSDVNAALGIDTAIDVSIFDPVANKGDGGVNDYLYEKGNQLTIIAYALQNIANNLNTTTDTTQDYFQSMAEVIDAEYAETESRVNIETEAFITKVLDSVISKKTLTFDETNKANTISALTSILPVIQVKASEANTVAIFNFATSTFQSDAQAIASGSATSEVISSYLSDILNYVATDQSLVASELEPDINAIIDSVITDEDTSIDIKVLNNDSYLTTSSITVDIDSPSDGTAYISNNIVNYSPDDNFFGTDSIAYNITQGNKTSSSSISLVINSVNDIPTFDNLLSTYRVDENQTAVTSISASDIEEEELTISLGGEDQSSFNLSNENVLTFNESPDYETKSDYELVISVTDGIDILDKSVSVKLNNLNDNIPLFASESVFNADENQTAIGSVTATDADGDALTYSISGEELSITSNGILSFASAPDYETNTSFTATVTVTDGLTSVNQDITVNVNNLNDNSPIFSSSESFSIEENKSAIGTVIAADADIGSSISYSIDNSVNQNIEVEIEANSNGSGNVYVISGVQKKSLVLQVGKTYSFAHSSEHPFRFSTTADGTHGGGTEYTTGVNTSTNGTTLITVNSETPANLYYYCSIHPGMGADSTSSSSTFPVISIASSGDLTFSPSPDFETMASFSAKVSASDGEVSTDQNIQVEIIDVDPEGPVFSTASSLNVDENQTAIGSVSATDPFGSVVTYSISGTDAESIDLETSSGLLTFKSAPDYETKTSYSVLITAVGSIANSDQELTININNLNDNEPVIASSATYSGDENQTAIASIVATDADGDTLTYSITGTELTMSTSGVLSFTSPPDYEETTSYTATVSVTDGLTSKDQSITVNVNNLNDNSPIFTSEATFSAAENQTAIGTAAATDADGDPLTFSISGTELAITSAGVLSFASTPDYETKTSYSATITSNDGLNDVTQDIVVSITDIDDVAPVITSSASFSVDENQTAIGTITVTDVDTLDTSSSFNFAVSGNELAIDSDGVLTFTSAPDYETKTSYTATVTASDGASNSSTQDITVSINNLNDNSPVFTSSASFSADENQSSINTVVSSDADGDDVTYSISGSEIAIDSSSGVITFVADPDYETKTSYSATVTSSDGTNSTTQDITVSINNLNDNSPIFTSDATFSAAENQTAIGTAAGTDADGDSIIFTVSGSELVITSAGVITFASAPNYETKNSYSATVTANDGLNTTAQSITVNVTDVNDAPVFTSSATLNGDENQTSIGSITGSDEDGNSLSFSVSGSELEITSAGVITFASAPNYETKSSYTATVSVTDSVVTSTQDITVNVNDVNDAPVATAASYSLNLLPQDQTSKTLTLGATDEDGDTLTYTIVSNGTHGAASFSSQDASQTVEVSVVSSGGGFAYVIDGTQKKSLTLNVGTTYTFTHPEAHPFKFSTTSNGTHSGGSEYTTGVTSSSGSTVIEVTASTPTTLYYYCSVHPGMGASASITNTNSNAGVSYQTSASTQSAQSESFTFKVNDGTVDSSEATISLDLRTDPLYKYQWHLNNTGQTNFATTGGTAGADLNVDTAIVSGITGSGVIVAVLDEGLELAHEDLVDNIVSGSYDFTNSDEDPTSSNNDGDHGTSVAGLIAAKGWNNKGGRGVAPDASLIGYNILQSGSGTNGVYQIKAWGSNPPVSVNADIYNMSYGRDYGTDDNDDPEITYDLQRYIYGPYEDALKNGVENLRNGKGAIYIQSSGNEFSKNSTDDCGISLSCVEVLWDNKSTLPYIMQVGALKATGIKSSYTTPGSALWISGFGGENGGNESIINSQGYVLTNGIYEAAMMTVDQSSCSKGYVSSAFVEENNIYYNEFQNPSGSSENPNCNYHSAFNGTSSAAPTIAGVVALMLDANPALTWRDVKHILATTADQIGSDTDYSHTYQGIVQYEWETNAAGYKFHNWFGFGKVDAAEAVSVASSYTANSRGTFVSTGYQSSGTINSSIINPNTTTSTISLTKPSGSNNFVEFVRVTINLDHEVPKSVGLRLQSPGGSVINIMQPMTNVGNNPAGTLFEIGVSGLYGEVIEGDWIIGVNDYINDSTNGKLVQWGIEVYGN